MDEIILNGSKRAVRSGATITELVRELELDPRWVVAELNGEPVTRERFGAVTLSPGDRIELVRAVAGG